jgi:hypothetical protein
VSEKFKLVGNRVNVRTVIKTKHCKTGPVTETKQMKLCIYNIPYDVAYVTW